VCTGFVDGHQRYCAKVPITLIELNVAVHVVVTVVVYGLLWYKPLAVQNPIILSCPTTRSNEQEISALFNEELDLKMENFAKDLTWERSLLHDYPLKDLAFELSLLHVDDDSFTHIESPVLPKYHTGRKNRRIPTLVKIPIIIQMKGPPM
jgi:hypothetical protein